MSIYLIDAPIAISYGPQDENMDGYMREYHQLGQTDDGELSKWLQSVKSKGEANDSDPVLLNLMIELHRKIDNLEKMMKQEKEPQKLYYGRLDMPTYPKRDVGIFFEAVTPLLAKIIKIHDRDQRAWNLYVRSRERVLIRELKEAKS